MRMRKGMAVIAAMVMTAVLSLGGSLAATSVGISDGAAAVTVNQTVVGFAGYEWWVIGDAKGGVYSKDKSVTLLSKNEDFGNTEFRKRSATELEGYKKYNIYWYEGSFVSNPNEYKDSTLQRKMVSIADGLAAKERGKINNRTLSASDDPRYPIAGKDIADQKLWPLSGDEYIEIGRKATPEKVRPYGKNNWLRSFHRSNTATVWYAIAAGGSDFHDNFVDVVMVARPALNLNVSSVIFTSDARVASGKAAATPGGGLVSVTAPDTTSTNNKIKYTFKDDENLKLKNVYVSKVEGNKVTVAYDGATAGKTLSVIAKDKGGPVKFYGKLSAKTAASGEGSFVVPDNFDFSKYDLEVFVEEINGENESDFASAPKALDMTVKNMVAVSGGTGGGLHALGTEVTLKADPAPEGKRFKGWKISPEVQLTESGKFTDAEIKFTMPDTPLTATVEYENVYTVTVNNASINGGREYAEGEEVTLTANQPASGKYFKGWSISSAVTLKDGGTVTSGIIKFDMPAYAVTATAEYEDLIVYPIKDGDNTGWTQGSESGLIITSVGEHRKFTGVTVDGNTVDSQHYTVESGSTIVTLKASYLSTLSVGEHVLRIHFTDGYTETKFSIQEVQTDKPTPPTTEPGEPNPPVNPGEPTSPVNPPVQPGEPNPPVQGGTTTATTVATAGTSPKTGDSNMIWIMVSVMLAAGVGFMVVSVVKKSKR